MRLPAKKITLTTLLGSQPSTKDVEFQINVAQL